MIGERFIYDRKLQKLVPAAEYRRELPKGPIVIKDIEPYQSMVTGERIRSRSHHREHLRDHNKIEIGNEMPPHTQDAPLPRAGADIKRAIEELRARNGR